ncbi:hypothetical protein EBR21_13280, partial [bacterium]|nr:hypothetical protein [bacterium]
CAQAMKVDSSKLRRINGSGSVAKDEVAVIELDRESLNVNLVGAELRGICVFTSHGAQVSVTLDGVKVGGSLTYQQGNGGLTTFSFGANGKLDSGIASFSGGGNKVSYKSAKLASCTAAPWFYSIGAGSVVCE